MTREEYYQKFPERKAAREWIRSIPRENYVKEVVKAKRLCEEKKLVSQKQISSILGDKTLSQDEKSQMLAMMMLTESYIYRTKYLKEKVE